MTRMSICTVLVALVLTLSFRTTASGQSIALAGANMNACANGGDCVAQPSETTKELAVAIIDRAAKADKYVFLFFYRDDDEATRTARSTFEQGMNELADRALFTTVDISDAREQALVAKYDLTRSPMPFVLALSPNGAVTRSFAGQFSKSQLATAIIGPAMQKALKGLQERKMVFVGVQNGSTQHNAEAMQGVREFAAEPEYSKTTEIITVDPMDASEADFLTRLKVDLQTTEAVTVFLAPPGTTVATYTGPTQKDVLVAAAKKAAAGCDKPGCCPKKKPADSQPQAAPTEKKP